MMINHHPDETYLAAYASGQLSEAESLVIASHAAICPLCRHGIDDFEAVGGGFLETLSPVDLSFTSLDDVLSQLDAPMKPRLTRPASSAMPAGLDSAIIPLPLRHYLEGLDPATQWQPVIGGLDQIILNVGQHKFFKTKLLRIRGGAAMPQHSHDGDELTLVLQGAFGDEGGHFARGDLAMTDDHIDHRPVADIGIDCICLTVTTDNLRLTGPFMRFLNPFVRF